MYALASVESSIEWCPFWPWTPLGSPPRQENATPGRLQLYLSRRKLIAVIDARAGVSSGDKQKKEEKTENQKKVQTKNGNRTEETTNGKGKIGSEQKRVTEEIKK